MQKKLNPELVDADNPEWSADDVKQAKSFAGLSESLQNKLARRARGPQASPTKERITIRLSPDVVETFRASGDGWQTRIDHALQDWLKTHQL